MKISSHAFGSLADGREVTLWKLESDGGLVAEVLDYGVTIRRILVPDKNGALTNVVLGYDSISDYESHNAFFGATVGRFANRIKGASFVLNGETYHLAANNGPNHIHGGPNGFHRKLWQAEPRTDGVVFSCLSPDGEEGYPGNLQVFIKISWQGSRLTIHYTARTDKDTVLNLTNHSYFNLDGGTVEAQELRIEADGYTPVGDSLIPTGEILPVEGTPYDFRSSRPIGCYGYDTNFVLSGGAVAKSSKSGITMIMDTTEPGVQLYTPGDPPRAFCLETQHFPDCIHNPQWPSCILRAGETFESETGYRFEVNP